MVDIWLLSPLFVTDLTSRFVKSNDFVTRPIDTLDSAMFLLVFLVSLPSCECVCLGNVYT